MTQQTLIKGAKEIIKIFNDINWGVGLFIQPIPCLTFG